MKKIKISEEKESKVISLQIPEELFDHTEMIFTCPICNALVNFDEHHYHTLNLRGEKVLLKCN